MPSNELQTISRNSSRANAAFMIGLFTILAALGFEHIGGYVPCELCLAQRLPYYIGLPMLALTIGLWASIPVFFRIGLTLLVAALFAWSTYLGGFHAGVEWGFWPGPTACAGTGGGLDFSDLNNINASKVVPCDQPQFRLAGISFAGYNAIISLIVSAMLVWSALGQYARKKREANAA